MAEVVIIDALRTPFGTLHGALAGWHPVDLLAETLRALAGRCGVEQDDVHELIVGCVEQVGGQGGNLARGVALQLGWGARAPGTTLDAGAVSGLEALRLAAAVAASGAPGVRAVGAVDLASLVPPGAAAMGRHPFGRPWSQAGSAHALVPPGAAADALAQRLGIGRAAQDAWAARSIAAADAHRAAAPGRECHAVPRRAEDGAPLGGCVVDDEVLAGRPRGIDEIAAFLPLYDADGGTVTAANAAPAADGAAAVLVAPAEWVRVRRLPARATLRALVTVAAPPHDAITAAGVAAQRALRQAGVELPAVELIDLHEPHAVTALALMRALGVEESRVNRHGGALAFGDPTATSTLRSVVSLAHALAESGSLGLQLVAGPDSAAALVLERSPYADRW